MKMIFLLLSLLFTSRSFSQENSDSLSQKWTLSPQVLKIDYRNKVLVKLAKDTAGSLSPASEFLLELITENNFPCLNYEIISGLEISGNKIIVTLHGIKSPVVCLAAEGPARSAHSLELKRGNYMLILRYDGIVDSYNVKISRNKISLDEDTVEFSRKREED